MEGAAQSLTGYKAATFWMSGLGQSGSCLASAGVVEAIYGDKPKFPIEEAYFGGSRLNPVTIAMGSTAFEQFELLLFPAPSCTWRFVSVYWLTGSELGLGLDGCELVGASEHLFIHRCSGGWVKESGREGCSYGNIHHSRLMQAQLGFYSYDTELRPWLDPGSIRPESNVILKAPFKNKIFTKLQIQSQIWI